MIVARRSPVARSLGRSLARSLARSIDHSLARSLARSIARSLTDMCSLQSQYKGNHKGGRAAEGRAAPFVVAAEGRPFVLALKRAHVSERASDRASERSSERVIDGASERATERATSERRTTIIVETQETMCLPERQCIRRRDNVSSRETMFPPERQCVFRRGNVSSRKQTVYYGETIKRMCVPKTHTECVWVINWAPDRPRT